MDSLFTSGVMSDSFFTSVMDELVQTADDDPELADGLRWLDDQAQRRGISFYDMAFEVLYRREHSISDHRAWLDRRN